MKCKHNKTRYKSDKRAARECLMCGVSIKTIRPKYGNGLSGTEIEIVIHFKNNY